MSVFDEQIEWNGRAFMLMDLDAFFASVEQLDHPEWRGKPVIVGGDENHRGVVSTASYEARKFGVRSAMPAATARRLCPDGIWTPGNFPRYRELSAKVMEYLGEESPLVQRMSIDEAYVDVTPGRFQNESPVEIAKRVQRRVADLGITCSIGIATSKVVAKIASDRNKPNGITVVYPGMEEEFLRELDVREMPGVGKSAQAKLHVLGIETIGDLAHANEQALSPIFGINAQTMINRASGIDLREIELDEEAKSISNEVTFPSDVSDYDELIDTIALVAAKVARRLRKQNLKAKTIVLKVKFPDLSVRTAQGRLHTPSDDDAQMLPLLKELFDKLRPDGIAVRLIGVGATDINEPVIQESLFDGLENEEVDHSAINTASDKIKNRFGDSAIVTGRELKYSHLKRKDGK